MQEKEIGSRGAGVQTLPCPTSLCDVGQDLPLRGLSFLTCKVRSGLVPRRRLADLSVRADKQEDACARVYPALSPRPPAPLPPAGTCLTRWGPWNGRGRAAGQDPFPHALRSRGLGRGGTVLPAPRLHRPRPRLPNELVAATARTQPLASPRRQLRSHQRLWGHLRAGSHSGGAPGQPARPRGSRPAFPASRPWAAAASPCTQRNPRYAWPGPERGAGSWGAAGAARPSPRRRR